jgi:hypothetical protein
MFGEIEYNGTKGRDDPSLPSRKRLAKCGWRLCSYLVIFQKIQ